MPKVTIGIPAYNAMNTIGETLSSLVAQSFNDFEIIVSDNHSTDDTCEVVKQFHKYGVKLVKCPYKPFNTGSFLDNCRSGVQNWNSLLNLGNSEYIAIYHADDIYEKDIVKKQVAKLDEHPDCSAIFTMKRDINTNGLFCSKTWKSRIKEKFLKLDQTNLLKMIITHNQFFATPSAMMRRSIWKLAGSFNVIFGQALDTEFWLRISGYGPVIILNEPLVRYRRSTKQDSASWTKAYEKEPIPILKVIEEYLFNRGFRDTISKLTFIHIEAIRGMDALRLALNYSREGNKTKSMEWLQKAKDITNYKLFLFMFIHRKYNAARIIAAKLWYFAIKVGLGIIVENYIRTSSILNQNKISK